MASFALRHMTCAFPPTDLAPSNVCSSRTLFINPIVSSVKHLHDERYIVPSEAVRALPLLTLFVFVKPTDGDVVARTVLRFMHPDRGDDFAEPDFVNGKT